MKRLAFILAVGMIMALPAQAALNDPPEHSLLFNSFSSLRPVDSFAVATTRFGLVVLKFDPQTELYEETGHLLLTTEPFTCKLYDQVAAVRSYADIVYFVDLSGLPDLTLLGETDIGREFYDFALSDQSLYVAFGFDGLWHYEMHDYTDAEFVDSSMIGIHYVQVENCGDTLMALDDYNGIIRYDLTAEGFGDFVDFFYLPLRARSFLLTDSVVVIPIENRRRIYLGQYGPTGPGIADSIQTVGYPLSVITADTFVVALDPLDHIMEVVSRNTFNSLLCLLPDNLPNEIDGDAANIGSLHQLLLPETSGGLARYTLENLWFDPVPEQAFARPGPVVDIVLNKDHLYTGGLQNPLEAWRFETDGTPVIDTTLYAFNNVGALAGHGEKFFVLYPEADLLFGLIFTPDSIQIKAMIPVEGDEVIDIKLHASTPADTLLGLLLLSHSEEAAESRVDLYSVSDNWNVTLTSRANLPGQALDAVFTGDYLLVSTDRQQLYGYRYFDDYSLRPWWTVATPKSLDHLVTTGTRVANGGGTLPNLILGFADFDMYRLDSLEGSLPVVDHLNTLPVPVVNSAQCGNRLYTTGNRGISVLDLGEESPAVLDYGGFAGHIIAADSTRLAVSDGTAIHLYASDSPTLEPIAEIDYSDTDIYALQNYPNPFNPQTNIRYYLPGPAAVEISIINLLGQQVAKLVDESQSTGWHTVDWDGRSDDGRKVASGVYFCRLITPDASTTHKMMLVK